MNISLSRVRRHPLIISVFILMAMGAVGAIIRQQRATDQLLHEGEEALTVRDYPKARERFTAYLDSRPGDTRARLLAARTARRMKEYYEAAEHLKRCRTDGGDNEAIGVEEALIDIQRGKESPGLALRQRANRGDEIALAILEVLIQFDLDTYQLYQARDELTLYLNARPDDLQARLARGYIWERFLYFADAVEDYRRAVANHPNSETARLRLADSLLIAGTPQEAMEQFQWLAQRWPDRLEVKFGLARCQRRLDQTTEAIRLLEDVLRAAPEHGEALWERGQMELDCDRPADAEAWLRRAVQALPHDRRINYSLFRCLSALGNAEAEMFNARVQQIDIDMRRLDKIRLAVMNDPNDPALRCEGGKIFLRNGEIKEGTRWLELALRLDPTCQAARAALANLASP